MYHSCQLFFETPYKTLKFQQKLLLQQTKKNINKHDRMKVFSSDIHGKIMFTNNVELPMILQSERVLEMHFLTIWKPEFQKIFFWCPPRRQ